MRTTVTIDVELFQRALGVADPGTDKADLFREAMKVFYHTFRCHSLRPRAGAAVLLYRRGCLHLQVRAVDGSEQCTEEPQNPESVEMKIASRRAVYESWDLGRQAYAAILLRARPRETSKSAEM